MSPGGEPIAVAAPGYPTLRWVARYGTALPPLVAILLTGCGGLLALRNLSMWWLAGGVMCAVVAAFVARVLVEIVCVLVETLIPQ